MFFYIRLGVRFIESLYHNVNISFECRNYEKCLERRSIMRGPNHIFDNKNRKFENSKVIYFRYRTSYVRVLRALSRLTL